MVLNIEQAQNIRNARNFQDALDIYTDWLSNHGYNNYFFSNMDTNASPAVFKVKDFHTNYDKKWISTYIENGYSFHDPVAIRVMTNRTPFYWGEVANPETLSPESMQVMKEASTYGICDGVGMSYLRNQGNLYTLTISKDQPIENYDPVFLSAAYFLGSFLVESYESYNHTQDNVTLTDQERRIIAIAAIGKTDSEIAQLLDISVNTVRYHWKNMFEKLNSYSRVFAIIQAMNRGLIDMSVVEVTTKNGSSETMHKAI